MQKYIKNLRLRLEYFYWETILNMIIIIFMRKVSDKIFLSWLSRTLTGKVVRPWIIEWAFQGKSVQNFSDKHNKLFKIFFWTVFYLLPSLVLSLWFSKTSNLINDDTEKLYITSLSQISSSCALNLRAISTKAPDVILN